MLCGQRTRHNPSVTVCCFRPKTRVLPPNNRPNRPHFPDDCGFFRPIPCRFCLDRSLRNRLFPDNNPDPSPQKPFSAPKHRHPTRWLPFSRKPLRPSPEGMVFPRGFPDGFAFRHPDLARHTRTATPTVSPLAFAKEKLCLGRGS